MPGTITTKERKCYFRSISQEYDTCNHTKNKETVSCQKVNLGQTYPSPIVTDNTLVTSQNSCLIAQRPRQGLCYPVEKQIGVEKPTAGTDAQKKFKSQLPGNQNQDNPKIGLAKIPLKANRMK